MTTSPKGMIMLTRMPIVLALALVVPNLEGAASASPALTTQTATLTVEGARVALRGAEKLAQARNLRVSIAVVDPAGNLLAFERLGNAMPASIENAIVKARTAAQLGAPSKTFQQMVDAGNPSMLSVQGISPMQGGIPLLVAGVVVGGIGCSGGSPADDETIANAGQADFVKANVG